MNEMDQNSSFLKICSRALEGNYGTLVQISGIILFVLIFNYFVKTLLLKLQAHFSKTHKIWALSFVSALHKPLTYFVWFVAIICTIDTISSNVFNFHLTHIHLLLSVGAVLAFGWFLLRWNHKVVQYMTEMSQQHQIPLTRGKLDLISKLATITAIFVTLFLLMDVTGRNVQTLIAFGGIGGLALAFASQQVISNFFGGVMVYITQPFTIGEWVFLPEKKIEGHIEEIGWYMTRIRNFEKRPIYVPNSIFTQTFVVTPSRMSHERFHPIIGLHYKDIQAVKPILDNIKLMLIKHPSIDQLLPIDVFFINFGPATLEIEISAYMSKTLGTYFPALRQELLLKIATIITQQGAEIITPTNIIEMRESPLSKNLDLQTGTATS
jgi:MscS family membrane protein